jgi:RNA polymerase sigma-70 factor (ECF subfamily)
MALRSDADAVSADTAPAGDDALVERLLVLRAQLGSGDAFTGLVDRYDARLLFYLRRLLGSPADAEDVRQEVWLTVVRKVHTLQDAGAFRTWLYRVARHRGISWLRRRRVEVPSDQAPLEEASVAIEAEETDPGPQDAAAMYAALDALAAGQREILCLRFLGGLAYEEIARVLDCPVGTVRSRLHYAKAALRAALTGSLRPQ